MATKNYTAQEAKAVLDELVAPTTDTVGQQEKASITRLRGQFGDIATAKITGSWGDQAYYKSTKYLGTEEPGSPKVRELLQELDRNRPQAQNAARDALDTRFAAAIKENPGAIDRFEETLRQDPSLKGRFIDLIANHPGSVSDEALRAIVTGNSQTIRSTIDQTLTAAKAPSTPGPATAAAAGGGRPAQSSGGAPEVRPPARAAGAGPAGQRGRTPAPAGQTPEQGTPQRTTEAPAPDAPASTASPPPPPPPQAPPPAPAPMASALAEMTRSGQILAGARGFAAGLSGEEQIRMTRHFDGASRAFGDLSPELQQKVGRRLAEDMAGGRTFDRNRFELGFNEQERRQLQDFSGNMMRSMESLRQDEALHQKFTQHMAQRSESSNDPMSAITNDPDFSEALKAMGPEAGGVVLRRLAEENRKDPGFAEKVVSLRNEYPEVFQNMMRQVGEGKKREGETPEQLNQRLNQMLTKNMDQLKQLAQFDGMKDALVSIVGMFSPQMAQWLDTKLTGLVGQAATNPTLSNLFGRMAQNMPGGQPPAAPGASPPPQGAAPPPAGAPAEQSPAAPPREAPAAGGGRGGGPGQGPVTRTAAGGLPQGDLRGTSGSPNPADTDRFLQAARALDPGTRIVTPDRREFMVGGNAGAQTVIPVMQPVPSHTVPER